MIELPWPAAILSPNARGHWAPKAKAFQKHKGWAHNACLAIRGQGLPAGEIDVLITAYPPRKGRRDKDNLIAQCKAYLDGIAWSFGIDDSRFDPRVQWGEPVKGGKIVVTFAIPGERVTNEAARQR